jgi:hypothetical protein
MLSLMTLFKITTLVSALKRLFKNIQRRLSLKVVLHLWTTRAELETETSQIRYQKSTIQHSKVLHPKTFHSILLHTLMGMPTSTPSRRMLLHRLMCNNKISLEVRISECSAIIVSSNNSSSNQICYLTRA